MGATLNTQSGSCRFATSHPSSLCHGVTLRKLFLLHQAV